MFAVARGINVPKLVTVRFAALVAFAASLAGCGGSTIQSENLEPNEIFQRYQVHYDKTQNKTFVQGDFFQNSPAGIALELTGKCQVTDNGTLLKRPADFAPFYKMELEGFVGRHDFVFTHRDGSAESNVITIEPVSPVRGRGAGPELWALSAFLRAPLPSALGVLSELEIIPASAKEYVFQWEGEPVRENESVYLIIENNGGRLELPARLRAPLDPKKPLASVSDVKAPNPKETSEVTRTAKYYAAEKAGEVAITLKEKQLEEIGEGNRTIKWQRVSRRSILRPGGDESGARVRLSASYVSETKPVTFEKRPKP